MTSKNKTQDIFTADEISEIASETGAPEAMVVAYTADLASEWRWDRCDDTNIFAERIWEAVADESNQSQWALNHN